MIAEVKFDQPIDGASNIGKHCHVVLVPLRTNDLLLDVDTQNAHCSPLKRQRWTTLS